MYGSSIEARVRRVVPAREGNIENTVIIGLTCCSPVETGIISAIVILNDSVVPRLGRIVFVFPIEKITTETAGNRKEDRNEREEASENA